MSPRRSSRARNSGPPPPAQATGSSASSISSGRTRSHNKVASPQTSNPRSQSLEDGDDVKPPPRRTRSGLDEVQPAPPEDEIDEDEEEEVTRCVCGQLEYPGLPAPLQEELKQAAKLNGTTTPEDSPEEGSGIFIQCDICKVWQHGGCVGILDDDSAPEEYFCEQCRKDLHSVATTPLGQRYSRYRPIHEEASPPNSPPPTRETRKANQGKPRASAEALAVKRRPTLNSYDEQEQLRRAIEESKKDGLLDDKKPPKRGRTDSEDGSPAKRQRTGSRSPERSNVVSSSDEALVDMQAEARNARETRNKDAKESRERERLDPKRKARRRGEDSPDSPQQPSAASSPPNGADEPRSASRSLKKPGPRTLAPPPAAKPRRPARGGPAGRDGLPPSSLANALDPNDAGPHTRSRSHSRAPESPPQANGANGSAAPANGIGGGAAEANGVSRPSRPKHMNPNRTSLNEMKKRVAGILEFVTKAQEDAGKGREAKEEDGDEEDDEARQAAADRAEFGALSSADMLKHLRGRLRGWESEYGRWGARA